MAANVALTAFSAMFMKKSKNVAGSGWTTGLFFTLFVAVFSIALLLLVNLFSVTLYPANYVFAFAYAAIGTVSTVVGLKAYAAGKVATYVVATTVGSTALPYLFGILFWNEGVTAVKMIGVALMLCAFVLKNLPKKGGQATETEKKKGAGGAFFLCLAGAVISGVANIVISYNARFAPETDAVSFSVLTQGFVFAIVVILLLARFPKTKAVLKENKALYGGRNFAACALYAATCGGALICSLEGAKHLPASVFFPVTCSGNIVLVTLLDYLFYKEKPTWKDLLAVAVIIPAIVLVSLG